MDRFIYCLGLCILCFLRYKIQYDIHGGQDLEDIKDVRKEIIQGLSLFEETLLQLVKRILVNDGQSCGYD